jgi:hypothetical protein
VQTAHDTGGHGLTDIGGIADGEHENRRPEADESPRTRSR